MSFDPRSLERLKELGRQLPQSLPAAEATPTTSSPAKERRHKVETEQNPQALFHELMQVSPDGTVPEHLMARLKQAEQRAEAERRQKNQPPSSDHQGSGQAHRGTATVSAAQRSGKGKNTRPQRQRVSPGSEEESLYVAFGQLLLEDEEDD